MDNIDLHISKQWFICFFPKYKNKKIKQLNNISPIIEMQRYTRAQANDLFIRLKPHCYGFTIDNTNHIFLYLKHNMTHNRPQITPLKQITETITHETIHIVLCYEHGKQASKCWDNISNILNDYQS